jgi:nitrous oxidase accessory protein
MNKLLSIFITLLLFAFGNSLVAQNGLETQDDSEAFQQLIDETPTGETLRLSGKSWHVKNITLTKPISIVGTEGTELISSGKAHTIHVMSDSVSISGITFRDVPVSFTEEFAAVYVDKSGNVTISDNTFLDNFFSIYLAESHTTTVKDNRIKGPDTREANSGNGIHLWYSKNVTIEHNDIQFQRDGIYFEFVSNSHVRRNVSKNNLRYGLHFMFSDDCSYEHNKFIRNGAGVAVMYTRKVVMRYNEFYQNNGANTYGLLLKEIFDSLMEHNQFIENTTAIYLEASARIDITKNLFKNNGWAIRLQANATDNSVHHNNFIGNSFDVATNSKKNYNNTFNKNYWSGHDAFDIDGNGYADLPYRPVSLFSVLVERNPNTLLLLKSPLINVLNTAERILPILTPDNVKDEKPQLNPLSL